MRSPMRLMRGANFERPLAVQRGRPNMASRLRGTLRILHSQLLYILACYSSCRCLT
jgi:hypothetical protein